MLRIKHYLLFIAIFLISHFSLLIMGFNDFAYAQRWVSLEQAEALQQLSPEQRRAIESEINKTGGVLTPEAIKALKERPEFKGLTPEEIVKGKELLEKKEELEKEEGEVKEVEKPVIEEKPKSLFDRYRVVGAYQDISTTLRPFGYEFFSTVSVKSLIPRKDIPVSPDYIIGPGDEVKILLWGRVNAQHNLIVDRDGNITIPQIGPLRVAGMRFAEMKNYLEKQTNQIVGASINVTMGELKSIQVFVLGEVRKPGSYALDSFSTITTAILAAGGPTEIGSLRNIELKRKDKTIVVMDFYNFLLKGDKTQDKVLQSGDVVFIPTVGPLVGVAGNVKRPAIYELKDKYDLMTLFDMAGGIIPSAYTQQIQVERIQKNERQIVVDINDKDLTKSNDFMLQDGDLVKVFPIVEKIENIVMLEGNVKRPGRYEYKPGMKVKDLIKNSTDLLKETYFEYALIKRLKLPGLETELVPFNLGRLLFDDDADNNIQLEPQDNVYIFSKWFFKDKPSVTVDGEVRKKGTFNLLENYKVKDAILEAGGLTKDANLRKGEIFRLNEQGEVTQIYFNVGLAMAEDPKENILLQDKDRIIIHSIWEEKYKHTVSVEGDVKNTGEYPLAKDMRISNLIFAAGNILESAYLNEAEVVSYVMDETGKSIKIDYKTINLKAALEGDPAHNLLLKPYDKLLVKRIPEWRKERYITLSGEFIFPAKYIIKKGERLSSVIERAGGYTDKAYLRGAVFTRESVRVLQQRQIDEMVDRLERELMSVGTAEISTALGPEEAKIKEIEIKQKREFVAKLRQVKAVGRMSIKLEQPELIKNTPYDIELEEGDSLFIQVNPQSIQVIGAVYNQTAFIHDKDKSYSDYIDLAGGYTENADKKRLYILKADGTAVRPGGGLLDIAWSKSSNRWEFGGYDLESGDTIVVPEKLERIAWLREIKDIIQILYQIAVTAGVLIAAF